MYVCLTMFVPRKRKRKVFWILSYTHEIALLPFVFTYSLTYVT